MLRPATESALASIAAVTRASVDCCTWASNAPGRSVPPRPRLARAVMKRRRVSGVISIRNQHTGVRGLNRFKNAAMLMVRLSLAAVWAHQGVWCKWMGRDRRHGAIADAAGFGWAVAVIG